MKPPAILLCLAAFLGAGAARADTPTRDDVQAAYCQALLANQREAVRGLPAAVGPNPELVRVVDAKVARIGAQLAELDDYLGPRRTTLDPAPLRLAARDVSLDQMALARAVSDAGCLNADPARSLACGASVRRSSPAALRQASCTDLSWLPSRR